MKQFLSKLITPLSPLIMPVISATLRYYKLGTYKGIVISSVYIGKCTYADFLRHTLATLQFIEQTDPRRFRRVQRELPLIAAFKLAYGVAAYNPDGRLCKVDGRMENFGRDPEYFLRYYAVTLIHEATHGLLCSRGISYTTKNRARVERICHAEECRFARRLDSPEVNWSSRLVTPFDERRWHRAWGVSQ